VVQSVAWSRAARAEGLTTREILLGTTRGQLLEAELEPTDKGLEKDDKYCRPVFRLAEVAPITGLSVEPFPAPASAAAAAGAGGGGRRVCVLVTTPTRIYQFVGMTQPGREALYETVFANYAANAGAPRLADEGRS
jgi:vacuolar protein sorting-associated protein 18